MKRRVFGILVALLLAAVGTAALVRYVKNAKDDAVKDEEQVQVLLVTDDLPQGATISEIRDKVKLTDVPRRLVAPDAVADLAGVSIDRVAAVELKKGDQLLRSRLVDAKSLVRVDVPAGLQQITIALDPERAVGASLEAGQTVGVLFSFEPFEITSSGTPAQPDPNAPTASTTAPQKTPNTTHFTLHKVLVTAVQFSQQDSERAGAIQGTPADDNATDTTLSATVAEAPSNQVLVTLAVSAPEAEQLVFAAEFGTIWLTSEGVDASEEGTRILTLSQVYIPVPRS